MSASGPAPSGDLTSGPILATLITFAMPTLASNVLQSLNGSINAIWVGRILGESALAATANANIIMFMVFSAAFGFGMAATVKVGQSFGARDVDAARRMVGTALGFCGALGLIVGVAGWFGSPALLRALGTPGDSFALALAYLRVTCVAVPIAVVSVVVTMSLRGAGDARTPLYVMILTVALDIVLNPLLILGVGPLPRLGIAGSALASALASLAGLIAALAYVYGRDLPLRLRGSELGYLIPRREELGYIIAKGLPMGAQMLLMAAAGIIMIGLVNREGLLTTAAYSATQQLWTYVQMPAMAVSAAVSAMAAQSIGAGRWDRLGSITKAGIITNVALTGTLVAITVLLDRPALALFLGPDSPAVPIAARIQLLSSWSFILFGVTMCLFGTMRANGVVLAPMFILAISMYPARLGFYAVGYPIIGADAIWLAFPAGSLVAMVLAALAYRRKGWRAPPRGTTPAEAAEESQADGEPAGRIAPSV
ncbi:MAG: MATE family efflux transporter [Novosphingobium sp.]